MLCWGRLTYLFSPLFHYDSRARLTYSLFFPPSHFLHRVSSSSSRLSFSLGGTHWGLQETCIFRRVRDFSSCGCSLRLRVCLSKGGGNRWIRTYVERVIPRSRRTAFDFELSINFDQISINFRRDDFTKTVGPAASRDFIFTFLRGFA